MAYGACSYLINDIEEKVYLEFMSTVKFCNVNRTFFITPATTKCIKIALGMLR